MTKKIFESSAIICLGAVSKEADLKQPHPIQLNCPPDDGRCEVCGKHISELQPFGGPDDPLGGVFSGELLVQRFRPMGPYDKAAEKAWQEAEKAVPGPEDILAWLISKYGEKEANDISLSCQAYETTGASWECRDCIGLSMDEYFEVIEKRWKERDEMDL